MKKLNYVTILVLGLIILSVTTNANGVRKEFKAYEITTINDLHVSKKVQAIWTVSYSNEEAPVTIVKRKTAEGIEYVVQGKFFAVSYTNTSKGFGAKAVRKSWTSVPKQINNAVINKEELARQEIILPNKVEDEYALGLIASYLPDLINDNYTHLLN
jgi:hypothetical protein